MTTPEPDAAAEELDEAARLLDSYAGELQEALTSVRALLADVAADWPDPTGAAWVDRADLLRRDLDRHAGDAADLAARATRAAADVVRTVDPAAGPLLAGTDARRVQPGAGMRIATLPER
ncbi:MAG: hypothetical protein EKK42_00955 [Pseudonocardiaceae bacterium]|nr:MAG: hypothetical protein EKK42_00955 [Pseudonocardiaceae bacterium]